MRPPAPVYIDMVLSWIDKQIKDEGTFPTKYGRILGWYLVCEVWWLGSHCKPFHDRRIGFGGWESGVEGKCEEKTFSTHFSQNAMKFSNQLHAQQLLLKHNSTP